MKKVAAILLTFVLAFSLFGCGATSADKSVGESGTSMSVEETALPETASTTESVSDAETTDAEPLTAAPEMIDGWEFDSETGTLYLNKQEYLYKTPYTGDLIAVKTVELFGGVTTVDAGNDNSGGLNVYPELKGIILGDSVQTLRTGAFDGCYKTEQIIIGRGVREIDDATFFGSEWYAGSTGCTGLKRIEVSAENPYFTTEDNVLYNKDRTELILYPMCREKTEYVMPDSVRSVRWFAFSSNQTIRKLTVGRGIESIEFSLFGCYALRKLILPDTLKSIGDSTIKYCGLRSVVIPDSVTTLGLEAFANCPDLEKIHVGKGVVLSEDADTIWFNSPVLKEVSVDADNPSLCMVDGAIFSKDRRTLFVYPGGYTREAYAVPNGTKAIAYNAFCENEHLKRVYIPASVTKIDASNFRVSNYEISSEATYPFEVWYGGSLQQWNDAVRDSGGTESLNVHVNAEKIG